jgi:hypothetical protein
VLLFSGMRDIYFLMFHYDACVDNVALIYLTG